jgi:hypothetical protein
MRRFIRKVYEYFSLQIHDATLLLPVSKLLQHTCVFISYCVKLFVQLEKFQPADNQIYLCHSYFTH